MSSRAKNVVDAVKTVMFVTFDYFHVLSTHYVSSTHCGLVTQNSLNSH